MNPHPQDLGTRIYAGTLTLTIRAVTIWAWAWVRWNNRKARAKVLPDKGKCEIMETAPEVLATPPGA